MGEVWGSGSYANVIEASLPDLMNKVTKTASRERESYSIDAKYEYYKITVLFQIALNVINKKEMSESYLTIFLHEIEVLLKVSHGGARDSGDSPALLLCPGTGRKRNLVGLPERKRSLARRQSTFHYEANL